MPESVDELFARALELHARGLDSEAKDAYIEVLKCDVTHLGALTNVGTLLFNGGFRSAARTSYRQAVACHPDDLMARVNYGNALLDADELLGARAEYEAALAVDPECWVAHQGLSYAFERLEDFDAAQRHRDLGFRGHSILHLPYRGDGRAVVALLLLSARGGNVNTDRFLDDRTFFVTKLFADYYDQSEPLPFHSFVFNAIGDAELCAPALEGARALLQRTNAAIVNAPEAVAQTGRAANAERLAKISGTIAPLTVDFSRAILQAPEGAAALGAAGFSFPLLLRSPGFHTGRNFFKVDAPAHLESIVEDLPGETLTAISMLDSRGADGFVRKYRVMIVDGVLYPLHLAVAHDWKVHFFSAAMGEDQAFRDEDAAFLSDLRAAVGERAAGALSEIAATLDLDYGGIDFGLDAGGNVLLFEANAAMLVPAPDADPRFAYRNGAIGRINAAVRAMLLDRAAR